MGSIVFVGEGERMVHADPGTGSPPEWLKVWYIDLEPADLVRFHRGGHTVCLVGRDYPGDWNPTMEIELPSQVKKRVPKLAFVWVFDPDGSVATRVQLVHERSRA